MAEVAERVGQRASSAWLAHMPHVHVPGVLAPRSSPFAGTVNFVTHTEQSSACAASGGVRLRTALKTLCHGSLLRSAPGREAAPSLHRVAASSGQSRMAASQHAEGHPECRDLASPVSEITQSPPPHGTAVCRSSPALLGATTSESERGASGGRPSPGRTPGQPSRHSATASAAAPSQATAHLCPRV